MLLGNIKRYRELGKDDNFFIRRIIERSGYKEYVENVNYCH